MNRWRHWSGGRGAAGQISNTGVMRLSANQNANNPRRWPLLVLVVLPTARFNIYFSLPLTALTQLTGAGLGWAGLGWAQLWLGGNFGAV